MRSCWPERCGAAGLTLIELLLVMAMSAIILVVLVRFLASGFPLSRAVFAQASATETARLQLKRMTKALREARYADTGAYPLVEMEPARIVFYSDVDADDVTERLRYELRGTDLERGVIKPTGEPLRYDPDDEQTAVVARHVRNGAQPVFTYYGGDYPADAAPLSMVDLTEVKYIQYQLVIDTDPAQDPLAVDLISQVQLRNLKTNLGETTD